MLRSVIESGRDEALIETAAAQIESSQRTLFQAFARVLLAGVGAHHSGGPGLLGTIAVEGFEWVAQRAPGEIRVRVRNPDDRPGHTVVEVLQDDHPFVVDSLGLAFARIGLQERLVIHPLLRIERDAEGGIEKFADEGNGPPLESYVYVELVAAEGQSASLKEIETSVRQVMSWVHDVTSDHRRMVRSLRELMASLEYAAKFLDGGVERAAKIERFLDWIIEGRFIFIGMRRYRTTFDADGVEAQIVPGSGLGMWRDDKSSRLVTPQRGAGIPDEIRDELEDSRIILISKSHMDSRIHRHGRLDRIVVKEHDDHGCVVGFAIIVGLFTSAVLRTPGSQIPLLSERLREVVARLGLNFGSHAHKAIVAAFDSAPVELLVGADVETMSDLLEELVAAAGSKSVRLVLRRHPRGRTLYAAILLPRENYREDLRARIRSLFVEQAGASYIDDRTSFFDDTTAVIHCFCTAAEGRAIEVDAAALEAAVRYVCSPWEDQLIDALRYRYGEERAGDLAAIYVTAFPPALRARTHPVDAIRDVDALEAFAATGEPRFALYFDREDEVRNTATLGMYLAQPPLLSDVIHVTDTFGIRVVDAQLAQVEPAGRPPVAVETLRVVPLGAIQEDLDAIAPRLGDALAAAFTKVVSNDAINGLVLGAGLDWRQVDLVRAYVEYFMQVQGNLSRPFLHGVLLENPLAVRTMVGFFEARFDPALAESERETRASKLRDTFATYRDRIQSLNEDRALSGLFGLMGATVRTNFFADSEGPHRVILKLQSDRISELSGVIPHCEIFVHSSRMMGVHLRGGPVARGGLRWSDRLDDLRLEVLELMSTQMLKNGIIVPVGAKGGFVLRSAGLSPNEARALADEQYAVFVESLLQVTDNLAPDGTVLPPEGVVRLDSDDPYLVVAADKGTSHLSDTANAIALRRDFWLGDAFASGGSEGYDHKKYGITARGAWECVKHHFAELSIDPEADTYTVAGIGDMSGDVFGNGMLLARRAKLLAAFDHRHIFLDPDPDPEIAWHERRRLFEIPRSSWADYDPAKLSSGGLVVPRHAKRVSIPAGLRSCLGLEADHASGQDLVRAILAMEVDLLWNGGIGTYVKASHESDGDAGDRTNDAVRIDASALRARVVGEGGNLGLTQDARVEAALRGVRLHTDAIDNSAGVDLSDHEVNYKIALAPLVRSGKIDAAARRELLFAVAEEACEDVLSHNRSQAFALSLDELRSRRDPELFSRAIEMLCGAAGLAPDELGLPDAEAITVRRENGGGLTRPELAVLLGLAKQQVQAELMRTDLPLDDYLTPLFRSYFPARFESTYPDAVSGHRLRAEIGALRIANRLIDAGGAALFTTLTSEVGVGIGEAAAAVLEAEDLLRIPDYRRKLLERADASHAGVYAVLIDIDDGVRDVAHYLIRSGSVALDPARIERWRGAIDVLRIGLREFLSPGEVQLFETRLQRFVGEGIPDDIAADLAALALADRGLNILRVCEETAAAPLDVARAYARLGDDTGINWVYGRLGQPGGGSLWDRMVLLGLRWDLLDLQRQITEAVLQAEPKDPGAGVDAFLRRHAPLIEEVGALERRASAAVGPSALAVVVARLRALAPPPARP